MTANPSAGDAEAIITLAHVWQEFRIRCIKLAIRSGATHQDVIEVADKLGAYILTKSERELGTTSTKDMP
jgi:hypothetical protein